MLVVGCLLMVVGVLSLIDGWGPFVVVVVVVGRLVVGFGRWFLVEGCRWLGIVVVDCWVVVVG